MRLVVIYVKHFIQFNYIGSVRLIYGTDTYNIRPMEVRYKHQRWALLETDEAAQTGIPVSVIRSYLGKLEVITAAPDERTLRNWKSLHYEKLVGDRAGQRSIRLNLKWRLVFTLDDSLHPPVITVLEIVDYHD